MKELHGRAAAVVPVAVDDCFALLQAVDRYPTWFDYVRKVEVLESETDGRPVKARAKVHVAQSPFGRDFELVVGVRSQRPSEVQLIRLQDGSTGCDRLELTWRLRGQGETRIELELAATVSFLPRFLPLGEVGDLVAEAVVEAAASALERR